MTSASESVGGEAPFSFLSKTFDPSQIQKYDVDLSPVLGDLDDSSRRNQNIAFILENIFTPEECHSLVSLAEGQGFMATSVNYGGEDVLNSEVRSGSRVIIDDEKFVEELWKRISSFIPRKVKGAEVVGLNERLRFLKYVTNQFFAPHTDGNYSRPYNNLEMSLLTIQMYLNHEFDGGETTFVSPNFGESDYNNGVGGVPVKPKTGMALIFGQDLAHEGTTVRNGVKYTVRTDVMYRYGVC